MGCGAMSLGTTRAWRSSWCGVSAEPAVQMLPSHGTLGRWVFRDVQERLALIERDDLVARNQQLRALAGRHDGVGGHVRPVGDPRLHIAQDDKVRQRVRKPRVNVVTLVVAVPPSLEFAVVVVLGLGEVARPRLDLGADDEAEVEAALVADRQEEVGAEVVAGVLHGAPPEALELGGHLAGAGGAGGFCLGCAHRSGKGS